MNKNNEYYYYIIINEQNKRFINLINYLPLMYKR